MPHAVDLTTLTDLKNYISPALGQTTASDPALSKIITAVSDGINRYVSRTLAVGTFAEVRNGNGRRSMRALIYPVLNVSSVVLAGFYGETGHVILPSANGSASHLSWDKWFINLRDECFWEGRQNITLNYSGGFMTPGQLGVLTLPGWTAAAVTLANAQIQIGGFYYESVNGGTTGATAPGTWLQTRNSLTNDNGIFWRCEGAIPVLPSNANMVPDDFQLACMQQSALLFKNRTRVGDTGSGVGPDRINYFLKDAHPSTISMLDKHREVFPTDGMGTV
jgi:hypothetical protein